MKKFERESYTNNTCINNPVKLLLIEDPKDRYYKEVVLHCGNDVVDIVYNRMGLRAKGDMQQIKTELVTYGFERAKELAMYFMNRNKMMNY